MGQGKGRVGRWITAEQIPKTWEGLEVWQWNEWEPNRHPFYSIVPPGFSRNPDHCKGIWYRLFVFPKPPKLGG